MTDVEHRLDEVAKAAATGQTRRNVVKLGLGLVGAAVTSAFGARSAWAGHKPGHTSEGTSTCAHFCNALFPPGPLRGACKSAGAHSEGICQAICAPVAQCGATLCSPTGVCTCVPPVELIEEDGTAAGGFCHQCVFCGGAPLCESTADCPDGTVCARTCCPVPICVPACRQQQCIAFPPDIGGMGVATLQGVAAGATSVGI